MFAAFTPGDLAVVRVGTGTGTLSNASTAVFIDEYDPSNGHLVQSIAMPTADAGLQHALTNSGTASSEGELNLSSNSQYLTLVGYDTVPGLSSVSSTTSAATPRTVGVVGVNGTVDTTTALTDFASGNNPRAATSTDGTHIWVAGADSSTGGVRYVSALGATTSTNLTGSIVKNVHDVEIFNGQLYFGSDKTAQIINAMDVPLPTSGTPTFTGLSGDASLTAGSKSPPTRSSSSGSAAVRPITATTRCMSLTVRPP